MDIILTSLNSLYYITLLYYFLATILATDGTYKLNYQGYPLIQFGTYDMDKAYHPFGIMVTKREKKLDFAFMCSELKRLAFSVHGIDFNPTICVADCAAAIFNGLESIYMLICIYILCWFHVKKAIEKPDGFLKKIRGL